MHIHMFDVKQGIRRAVVVLNKMEEKQLFETIVVLDLKCGVTADVRPVHISCN